jgi:hypothetical protein
MLVAANERYGKYYAHARDCTVFLSLCITSVERDRMMFGRFFAQMKKHHTLALFSALRLHKVQAMMNLRQVLEAGAAAAFAIANPEKHHFAETDEHGILDPSCQRKAASHEAGNPTRLRFLFFRFRSTLCRAASSGRGEVCNVFPVAVAPCVRRIFYDGTWNCAGAIRHSGLASMPPIRGRRHDPHGKPGAGLRVSG